MFDLIIFVLVAECKERWKNLRAVFVRHLKPRLSGSASKNKKPYYLTEAMQFTVPFIKALYKTSGNLSDVTQQQIILYNDESDNEESFAGQSLESPGLFEPKQSPSPLLPLTPPPMKPQQQKRSSERHTESTFKHAEKRVKNSRSEAIKMFLLSMLPDLESMTDIQVRQFKRRCLQTIDEILLSSL